MQLFDDKERTSQQYSNPLESTYAFLDRICLSEFSVVRNNLNIWFSHYPNQHKKELKARFNKESTDFEDAFFELYLHEMFISRGFTIYIHPELKETRKQPDFHLIKDNHQFYLEAKVVRDESDKEKIARAKKEKVAHSINQKIKNFPYWISISRLKLHTTKSFTIRPLEDKIMSEAYHCDYFQLLQKQEEYKFTYVDKNLEIDMGFLPRSQSKLGIKTPAVGIHGYGEGYISTNSESLKKAILKKSIKYGKLDKPLIIGVNSLSPSSLCLVDIDRLLGRDIKHMKSNKKVRSERFFEERNGIFQNSKLNHVAGILITSVTSNHSGNEQWFWCPNPHFRNTYDNQLNWHAIINFC